MKIVRTFAPRLFAFHFPDMETDELERIFDDWENPEFLFDFFTEHEGDLNREYTVEEAVEKTRLQVKNFRNRLTKFGNEEPDRLSEFFQNLHNQEYKAKILSDQKAKQNWLRLYALKISDEDDTLFVITGGMIKLTHLMEDRPHGLIERNKINRCKDFLKNNGVIDTDSFIEIFFEL